MDSTVETFERLLLERGRERYVLKLYITGMTPRSTEAVSLLKRLCDELLRGRYDLEVVDLFQNPARARDDLIIAAPTLVRESPLPERRMIGNLSDRLRVLHGLGL